VVERRDSGPLSIQGEHARDTNAPVLMDLAEVDQYVDSSSDEVLACRERGRHIFPSIRQAGISFIDVTDDGLLVRQLLCTCCQLAQRVELWETTGRGRNTRYAPVSATINYLRGPNGERYLGPQGHGRMTPKMVRNSLASQALHGQSAAAIRKEAKQRAQKHDRQSRSTLSQPDR
jgi:hypothetical protein